MAGSREAAVRGPLLAETPPSGERSVAAGPRPGAQPGEALVSGAQK